MPQKRKISNGVKIRINAKFCSGCRTCELICALTHEEENNPKKAFIKIRGRFPNPGGYTIEILEGCKECGLCAKFCLMHALFKNKKESAGVEK